MPDRSYQRLAGPALSARSMASSHANKLGIPARLPRKPDRRTSPHSLPLRIRVLPHLPLLPNILSALLLLLPSIHIVLAPFLLDSSINHAFSSLIRLCAFLNRVSNVPRLFITIDGLLLRTNAPGSSVKWRSSVRP